jgi:AmmeMemoRadiSam system protein B
MTEVSARPADLAGRWYPGSKAACERFLEQIEPSPEIDLQSVFGAIVPHAGWVYSGAVAYRTLSVLAGHRPNADLVIVFGGHLGPRDKPRVFIEGAWDTPLGPLEIERGLAQDVSMAIESDLETPDDYFDDNAIEVLMPMLKKLWPKAQVLTVGMPPIEDAIGHGADVVELAKVRGHRQIAIVGSTDLTHYGPNYDYRPQGLGMRALEWVKTKNDPEIIEKIEALDGGKVLWTAQRGRNACCAGAIAASLAAAKRLGAKRGKTVQYTTSFDVRHDDDEPSSFVGYVGVALGA